MYPLRLWGNVTCSSNRDCSRTNAVGTGNNHSNAGRKWEGSIIIAGLNMKYENVTNLACKCTVFLYHMPQNIASNVEHFQVHFSHIYT